MAKVLVIKSSMMGEHSQTSQLIDQLLKQRVEHGLHDEVIMHDLAKLNLPVLDAEIFHALRGAENDSSSIQKIVKLSDQLIAELKQTDLVLIGAPMYNLNVPTQLKNWFDLVVRARHTFRYTESYPQGLVEGVKAIVVSSRGGVHVGQATDAVTPYLTSVLGLIGIQDVKFIYAEGLDIPTLKENALKDAYAQAQQVVV